MTDRTIGRGVIAPILTPFNDDGSIALDLYADHAHRLLDDCAGLAPFGTTGEALSVGIDERIAALDHLIGAGIDPTTLIPGTGLTNVADTARLSAACLERGCAGVMALPPFYYKSVSDEGLVAYFEQLVAAIGRADVPIYLYHIPQVAGVGIPTAVVRTLHDRLPRTFVGIKDSTGDWDNTRSLLEIDGLTVYPGSEMPLIDALALGAPGCISATANLNAAAIASVISLFDQGDLDGAKAVHEAAKKVRLAIQPHGAIPAQKSLLARSTGDRRWNNLRAPLAPLSEADGSELLAALDTETEFKLAAA
ncbi:MAG: dihydrodipicolinate synthase family protein [Pseudomonadota bacterium]